MSPVTAEISNVMPGGHGANDQRSWAVPIRSDDQKSFAELLVTRQQDAAVVEAAPPAQLASQPPRVPPGVSVWQQMRFLATATVSKLHWRVGRRVEEKPGPGPGEDTLLEGAYRAPESGLRSYATSLPLDQAPTSAPSTIRREDVLPVALGAFPRPVNDNGWGMHWIPTLQSASDVVDRFVAELKKMGIKWTVFLNNGTDIGANDYLVHQLTRNGIMPVMRIYTPGLVPIEGDLEALVRHYKELGVSYFQLYNEPNLELETNGQQPDVQRYLDLWVPAAKRVLAAGGLPGFGALSPNGEFDDRQFLRDALAGLKRRGEEWVLNRGWLSMHNYGGPLPLDHPDGFLRFQQYAQILRDELGRMIPVIGTEAGSYVTAELAESRQVELVAGAYRYMEKQREPYNFAYTYWIVANKEGGGKDESFEWQALFQPGGWISPLVKALRRMVTGR